MPRCHQMKISNYYSTLRKTRRIKNKQQNQLIKQRQGSLNGFRIIQKVDEVLLEMMEAISEACETNPKLSVSIATEDKTLQAELANAYQQFGINKIEAGENAGLDDEDEEPPMATWEKI